MGRFRVPFYLTSVLRLIDQFNRYISTRLSLSFFLREVRTFVLHVRRGNVQLYRSDNIAHGREKRIGRTSTRMNGEEHEQWETSRLGAQVNFPPDRDFACATDRQTDGRTDGRARRSRDRVRVAGVAAR